MAVGRQPGFEAFRVSDTVEPVEHPSGKVKIERINVTREDMAWATLRREPRLREGPLTRLLIGGGLMMSDGLGEYLEHFDAISHAYGHVLVNGLGLGCYVKAVLAKPSVERVTVIELLPEVIELVGPYYTSDKRVEIIHDDAFDRSKKWPRGSRWDCVWNDLWPSMSSAYLPQMHRLNRSYGQRAKWVGSWSQAELLRDRR